MALIPCPECGWHVSSRGRRCPQCDYPIAEAQSLAPGGATAAVESVLFVPVPPEDSRLTTQPEEFVERRLLLEAEGSHHYLYFAKGGDLRESAEPENGWQKIGTFSVNWPTATVFVNSGLLMGKYRLASGVGTVYLCAMDGEVEHTLYQV